MLKMLLCSKVFQNALFVMASTFIEVNKEHDVTQFSVSIRPTAVVEVGHRYTCEDNAHY